MYRFVWMASLLPLFFLTFPGHAEELDHHITLYGSVMANGALVDMAIANIELEPEYRFAVLAAGKKIANWRDEIDFEMEGQIVRHFAGQHLWEFNALIVARWLYFPWNHKIKTSFAAGEGLSYASEPPEFEEKHHGGKTSAFLNYLMFEVEFALPQHPRWGLVTRVHHRSGVFGLFNGVHGAMNAYSLGIRYHF